MPGKKRLVVRRAMFLKALAIHTVLSDLVLHFTFCDAESSGCFALISVSVFQGFLNDVTLEGLQDLIEILLDIVHDKAPSGK